jgi:N-acetyl-alpha-D-muramate 1-phosphate uridylyltransferase
MKAMILAAGRGERLRPQTDVTPKPLIRVGKHRLIEYHLHNLAAAGVSEVVINISWLRDQVRNTLGDGGSYGLNIRYSDEGDQALETAGGIINALPLLGDEPFILINGDIWSDFDLASLLHTQITTQAHLVLVNNPAHHRKGDFALQQGLLSKQGEPKYTYSGIGVFSPVLFEAVEPGVKALGPILKRKSEQNLISGKLHLGRWLDIGTSERLQSLREILNQAP